MQPVEPSIYFSRTLLVAVLVAPLLFSALYGQGRLFTGPVGEPLTASHAGGAVPAQPVVRPHSARPSTALRFKRDTCDDCEPVLGVPLLSA